MPGGIRKPGPTEPSAHTLRSEIAPTLRLAWPVVLAELGWMAMGFVDLVMVGRLGPEAIAAVGLGNITYFAVVILAYGLILGLDTLVSQDFGAGRLDRCHQWMIHGLYVAAVAGALVTLGVLALVPWLSRCGIEAVVAVPAAVYLRTLAWSTLPLLGFAVLRRYLQAMNVVRAVTVTLLAANLLNFAGNWLLIEGRWGMPRLGVAGSAWATNLARLGMCLALVLIALAHAARSRNGLFGASWRLDVSSAVQVVKLGAPIAAQLGLEVGVFALAALLAGRLGASALAAHEVVLNVASITFMVPLGIASAGAVRVGQAIGRGDPPGAARAGWAALLLGGGFMACSGLALLLVPRPILGLFTAESAVIRAALPLLVAAAMFQLFDGLQVVAGGALRGAGDTRTPLFVNLAAHWTIGLPIGFVLAFPAGYGITGLWIGLAAGLICCGSFLLDCWARAVRKLDAACVVSSSA